MNAGDDRGEAKLVIQKNAAGDDRGEAKLVIQKMPATSNILLKEDVRYLTLLKITSLQPVST